jgi:hypothetical protein
MRFSRQKGIALAAAVMLMVFASIAVWGVVSFITQRLNQQPPEQAFLKTIYLAQAGIHDAIYYFRFHDLSANGYFTLGQTNIDAGNFFVLTAAAADLLMVDTLGSRLRNNNRNITDWNIQNATNSNGITITSMTVSWSGVANNRRLQRIYLNSNNNPVWSGNGRSGSTFNIRDFTLDTSAAIYGNNALRFNNSMSGANVNVNVTFNMSDGTSKAVVIYPSSNNYNFTVKSTGRTTGSAISRAIQADYNAPTGKIIGYKEI